jgi:hypothetical protein
MAFEHIYVGKDGAQELYRRLKSMVPIVDGSIDIQSDNAISNRAVAEALGQVTSFVKADGIGPDLHPDVENPSGRVIYLVRDELAPNPDQYKEWIWSIPPDDVPMWECIGSTSVEIDTLLLDEVTGTVSGSTMEVFADNGKYTIFSVPASVSRLFVDVAEKNTSGSVSRPMFEFTVEDGGNLETLVVSMVGEECPTVAPHSFVSGVKYQGSVINGLANVTGYPLSRN